MIGRSHLPLKLSARLHECQPYGANRAPLGTVKLRPEAYDRRGSHARFFGQESDGKRTGLKPGQYSGQHKGAIPELQHPGTCPTCPAADGWARPCLHVSLWLFRPLQLFQIVIFHTARQVIKPAGFLLAHKPLALIETVGAGKTGVGPQLKLGGAHGTGAVFNQP